MSILDNWCKGEGLDLAHAIVVKVIPADATVEHTEETLMTIKVLGRVKVRGWMLNPQSQMFIGLCECSERANPQTIPPEVPLIRGGEPWLLHGPTEEEEEARSGERRKLTACDR